MNANLEYVLITGASSGLGYEYAIALAAQQQNLIITARREDRLITLANDLQKKHAISVKVITADLAQQGATTIVETISSNKWQLCGLINNAGFGIRLPFSQIDPQQQIDMINVNVTSLVTLTQALHENLKQGRNPFVINVASTASFQSGPYMATYYATKAFVRSFSDALTEEFKKDGIKVSCICPGPTTTEFGDISGLAGKKWFQAACMRADTVVNISLKNIHKAVVIAGFRNKLLMLFSTHFPANWRKKIIAKIQQQSNHQQT